MLNLDPPQIFFLDLPLHAILTQTVNEVGPAGIGCRVATNEPGVDATEVVVLVEISCGLHSDSCIT